MTINVILTGATGFIGGEILRQLIERPDVGRVTCLTRRPIPPTSAKVESIVVDDFTSYDSDLLAANDACLWAMGSRSAPDGDKAGHEQLTVAYPTAFVASLPERPFRFCYLSAWGGGPTVKGRAENELRQLATRRPDLSVHSFRPAKVLPTSAGRLTHALYGPLSLGVDTLARAMIRVAVDTPATTEAIISNRRIKTLGHQPKS
ncbi:SDR family oxidoreductase [Actinoplanes sp. NPDC049265]|uniref:SDR family oxidoreductase n=1 Tax=Actinoplanes sp. NPDC049265 TaxID=3363902 RepID=UPI00371F518E